MRYGYALKECAREAWANLDALGSVQPVPREGVAHALHETIGGVTCARQVDIVEENDREFGKLMLVVAHTSQ